MYYFTRSPSTALLVNMGKEVQRENYFCDDFVTLNSVKTWEEFTREQEEKRQAQEKGEEICESSPIQIAGSSSETSGVGSSMSASSSAQSSSGASAGAASMSSPTTAPTTTNDKMTPKKKLKKLKADVASAAERLQLRLKGKDGDSPMNLTPAPTPTGATAAATSAFKALSRPYPNKQLGQGAVAVIGMDEETKKPRKNEEKEETWMKKRHAVDETINRKVSLWHGDMTKLEVDVIVNAANTKLLGGGGVDGCIHKAAGDTLLRECRELGGCKVGHAKITYGHHLPAKFVIHAVGPHDGSETHLRSAYQKSLELMQQHKLWTIAFPCIATGIFGYPTREAAHVALSTVREFMNVNKAEVDRIIFATFTNKDLAVYEELMPHYFPTKRGANVEEQ